MINPEWRRKAARHPLAKAALHPMITLTGLLILLMLVFFGTLYQADNGLYEAQRVFFGYIIWVADVVPFPGTGIVLWVLSLQLLLVMLLVLPLSWKKVGLWIVHGGLLLLLVGGFITQTMAVESQLTLAEGETGHYTTAYQEWEVAAWTSHGDTNIVLAYADDDLRPGAVLNLAPHPARLTVKTYYPNAAAFTSMATGGATPFLNASRIAAMEPRKSEKEAAENAPGVIATLSTDDGAADREILLYGLERNPLAVTLGGERVFLQMRRRNYPLDFSITLRDFKRVLHPGTEVAKSFESTADLHDGGTTRPVRIWMNNPLRYKGYTFFQASFSLDGGERSTFAVVTNPGRVLPYVSSLMVFGGMLLHFALHFLGYVKRTARA